MFGIINHAFGFFSKDMGIDLGTCNTLVAVRGEGVVLSEPSVVAVKKGTSIVLLDGQAVGDMAKDMLGKAPGTIDVVRPMKDGVIADFDVTEAMIGYFIQKIHKRKRGIRPRVCISIPSGITAVEKRAVVNSAERAGARKVYLVEEPVAAGIGAGMPLSDPVGSMIVDIGGGTTEVAVLSLGGLVAKESIRVAGDEFDASIVAHMKKTYNLLIGEQSAERIKKTVGSAYPLDEEVTMEVSGRDLSIQMPRRVTITSEEIREALSEPIESIVGAVKSTLERTPPELSADLVDRGLVLAGGGGMLRNLDKALYSELGIPVSIADDPLTCVARGTGVILENIDALQDTLESGDELD
jgi:rod shape-determining protein MreB